MPFARSIILSCAAVALAGCNPLAGLATDKVVEVADNQRQSFDLLSPERKLPATATRITAHILHFQDTSLRVKFDAPLADAESFMRQTVGKDARNCYDWPEADALEGWPEERPPGGLCLQDTTSNGPNDNAPAITIAIIPRGQNATVLVHTFTT